jgi:hypothetical protein
MQAPIVHEQITVEFARKYAKWKLAVKKEYAHKFVWVKEGDTVKTPCGRIGKVSWHNYHPDNDIHCIEVSCGSKLLYFHCPYQLQPIRG